MNIRTLAAFVMSLTAAGTLAAQSLTVKANIPFNFVVSGATLPAGEYSVGQADSRGPMIVRGGNHDVSAFTLAAPAAAQPDRPGTARLVFHRYGDQYFLYQVWTPDGQGEQIQPTRLERELTAHGNRPIQAVVAALR